MPDEKGDAKDPPGSPLAKAADRIRASAQYLLAAFAAVGAVFAAGLQLGDLGDVSTDDIPRLVATVGGIGFVVLGLAMAIYATAEVSTESYVDLPWLLEHESSRAATVVRDDVALRQGKSLRDIKDELDVGLPRAAELYAEKLRLDAIGDAASATEIAALKKEYDPLRLKNEHLRQIRADILEVASFQRVRSSYEAAKAGILGGAVLAAVGITAFAWGANAPDEVSIDPGEIAPKTPSEVSVVLTQDGQDRFRARLGAECDLSNVAGIVFEVTNTTYEVVSERTDDCASVTMTITPEVGQVLPRIKADAGDAEGEGEGTES